jgi:hypothetical protein
MIVLVVPPAATIVVLMILNPALQRMRSATVPGSYRNYQVTTLLVALLAIEIVADVIAAIAFVASHASLIVSAAFIALACRNLRILYKLLQDDNWFNHRYKRFARRLQTLSTNFRLSSLPASA